MRTLVDDALRPVLVQTTVTRIMTLLAPFKMWCSSSSTETLRQCFQIFPPKPHFLSCMNGKLNSLWILLAPAQIQNACGLKWQMIGCYCRGWWGLPAEPPGAAAAASLQGMVAAVYTEHTLPAPSPLPLPAPPATTPPPPLQQRLPAWPALETPGLSDTHLSLPLWILTHLDKNPVLGFWSGLV